MEHASPFRASPSLHCPVCPAELGAGPLHHCRHCKGTWIEEASLAERVGEMREELPRSIAWSEADSRNRPCASCGDTMESLVIFDVTVDRCAPHGVWFERDGLTTVLERSTQPKPVPVAVATAESASVGIDPGTVALGAVEVAASGIDVIGVVGDVGGAVLETVLDVVGAIFEGL